LIFIAGSADSYNYIVVHPGNPGLVVEEDNYTAYRGPDIQQATQVIQGATEVVTYNGKNYDLKKLGEFAGLSRELPLTGTHRHAQRLLER
jgi:hypothetical protein